MNEDASGGAGSFWSRSVNQLMNSRWRYRRFGGISKVERSQFREYRRTCRWQYKHAWWNGGIQAVLGWRKEKESG